MEDTKPTVSVKAVSYCGKSCYLLESDAWNHYEYIDKERPNQLLERVLKLLDQGFQVNCSFSLLEHYRQMRQDVASDLRSALKKLT